MHFRSIRNSKTKAGFTALHFAAKQGHTPLIEFLVKKHNATIDSMTMKKQTPLHLAAMSGKLEVCKKLVELGASLDVADDNGQKAIHLASQADQVSN